MATIDDIIATRDAAVHILDQEIADALAKQNSAASDADADKFDQPIHSLMSQRTEIFVQAANAAMSAPQLQAALDQLRSLTADMTTVAARMGSVTGFLNNVNALIGAGSKIVNALKGP